MKDETFGKSVLPTKVLHADWDMVEEEWRIEDLAKLPVHPACAAIPMHDKRTMNDMVADLKDANRTGALITLPVIANGQLIDGRGRIKACVKAGVKTSCVIHIRKNAFNESLTEEETARLVYSLNVPRRHLTAEQRAAMVLAFKGMKWLKEKTEEGKKAKSAGGNKRGRGRVSKVDSTNTVQTTSAAEEIAEEAKVGIVTAKKVVAEARREAGLSPDKPEPATSKPRKTKRAPEPKFDDLCGAIAKLGAKESKVWLEGFKSKVRNVTELKQFTKELESTLY